jgi:hypothetical protein
MPLQQCIMENSTVAENATDHFTRNFLAQYLSCCLQPMTVQTFELGYVDLLPYLSNHSIKTPRRMSGLLKWNNIVEAAPLF